MQQDRDPLQEIEEKERRRRELNARWLLFFRGQAATFIVAAFALVSTILLASMALVRHLH